MPKHGDSPTRGASILAHEDFDGKKLCQFLKNKGVFKGNTVPPKADAFDRIAELIAIKRNLYRGRLECINGDDVVRREAGEAVKTLRRLLPELQKNASGAGAQQIDQLLSAANGIRVAARLFPVSDVFYKGNLRVDRWHDFVEEFANIFSDIMQSSAPANKRLGNSYDGPVSRFLEAIIPQITGEVVTKAAVAKYLQRASRGDNRSAQCP